MTKTCGCCWSARRHGLTMVESLAVVVVLGVLLAALVPSIRRSFQHASATVCRTHLHSIDQALHAYRLDNGGWLPDVSAYRAGARTEPECAAWYGRLFPRYLAELSVLTCPSDPVRRLIDIGVPLDRHPDPANASSFGLNDVIRAAYLWNLDRHGPSRPSQTILLADLGPDDLHAVGDTLGALGRGGGRLPWDDAFHPAVAGLNHSWLTGRHFGHVNMLSIGGSVYLVPTRNQMEEPIRSFYSECAAGGCPLCRDYRVAHYSFASSQLFWWTGPLSGEN